MLKWQSFKGEPFISPSRTAEHRGAGWRGISTTLHTQALSTLWLRHNIALPAHGPRQQRPPLPPRHSRREGGKRTGATPCPLNSWPGSCRQSFRRHPPGHCRVTGPCRAARAPGKCNHRWWPSSSSCDLRFRPQRKGSGYWGTNHRISHNTLFCCCSLWCNYSSNRHKGICEETRWLGEHITPGLGAVTH